MPPAWQREEQGGMRAAVVRCGARPGTARLPGTAGPGPAPAATPGTRLPTHCWQHRGAIQPLPARCLPAPRTTGTFVSICGDGLNGAIVTMVPGPASPLPCTASPQPGLAPQPAPAGWEQDGG